MSSIFTAPRGGSVRRSTKSHEIALNYFVLLSVISWIVFFATRNMTLLANCQLPAPVKQTVSASGAVAVELNEMKPKQTRDPRRGSPAGGWSYSLLYNAIAIWGV